MLLLPLPLCADIILSGSSTILPMAKEAAKPFHEQTGIHLLVEGGGSEQGLEQILSGDIDIAMVSRTLSDSEIKELAPHHIGYDGIAVIVNSAVPLKDITQVQLQAIYSGRERNWRAFGAGDKPITVIAKREGHATRKLFDTYCGLQTISPDALLFGPNSAAIVVVGTEREAVGYVSIGAAEEAIQFGLPIRLLALDGIQATRANIVNGHYPILRELNLVTKDKPRSEVLRFIHFMQGEAGQAILRKYLFIPLDGEQAPSR